MRSIGFGIGEIPWDKIYHYAKAKELEPDVAECFIEVIRAMDGVYLAWQAEIQKDKAKK